MAGGDLAERRGTLATDREVGDEWKPLLGAVVDDVIPAALGERVLVLYGGDRRDRAGLLDLLDAHLRQADVPDLPLVLVVLNGPDAGLDRSRSIDAMEVVQLDRVGLEPTEALLDLGSQHLGGGVVIAALGGHHAAVRKRREGRGDRALALASGVQVCGVDHVDPCGERLAQQRTVLRGVGEPVGAQADPGDLDVPDCQPPVGAHRVLSTTAICHGSRTSKPRSSASVSTPAERSLSRTATTSCSSGSSIVQ